jgi:hypothetical protein
MFNQTICNLTIFFCTNGYLAAFNICSKLITRFCDNFGPAHLACETQEQIKWKLQAVVVVIIVVVIVVCSC